MSETSTDTKPVESRASALHEKAPLLANILDRIAHLTCTGERYLDNLLATRPRWIAAICAVLALQLTLITTHRPWLDEWQAIEIAVQTRDWSDLLANLRYEGHPPLWYAILRRLAHVAPRPELALPLAAALLAVPTQLTILLAAPFSRSQRLALALSEFVLFEFLTVSRSMTLGVACVVLAVALWRRSGWSWLFLVLLPQCDFLFGVLSVVLVGLRWAERRLNIIGLLAWGLSGLLAAWCVRPMADIAPASTHRGPLEALTNWLAHMGALGLPLQWQGLSPQWNQPPPPLLGAAALFALFAMAWAETRHRPREKAILGGFALLTLAFSLAVYELAIRHLMLNALLLIALIWLRRARGGDGPCVWTRAWLGLSAACGLLMALFALTIPFNRSPEAAAWITAHHLEHERWVSFPDSSGQGIAAINAMRFERLGKACTQVYVRWNNPQVQGVHDGADLYIILRERLRQSGPFYLLSDFELPDSPGLVQAIGTIPAGLDGQVFHFYEIGPGKPKRTISLPICTETVQPFASF